MDFVKKLTYQSWHRGTRENDFLLGTFADAILPTLTEDELKAYESLLCYDDATLFAWITGQMPLPETETLLHRLRDFHQCH